MTSRNLSLANPYDAGKPVSSQFLRHFRRSSGPSAHLWTDFPLYRRQTPAKDRRHACQVVRREGERRLRLDLGQANEARFAQATDGLAPAEYLLDQLAFLDAHLVAGVARRTRVDGAVLLLRHMRRDLQSTQLLDEVLHVVALVGAQGRTGLGDGALCHSQSRFAFGGPGGERRL